MDPILVMQWIGVGCLGLVALILLRVLVMTQRVAPGIERSSESVSHSAHDLQRASQAAAQSAHNVEGATRTVNTALKVGAVIGGTVVAGYLAKRAIDAHRRSRG